MAEFNDGMAETRPPQAATVTTDVLIVGSGPAGASAALFLSTLGVDNIMVTKYRWTANTPRAHITNQRTMEVFRDLDVEDDVLNQAVPHELMGETVFCTSLAGHLLAKEPYPSIGAALTPAWTPERRSRCRGSRSGTGRTSPSTASR